MIRRLRIGAHPRGQTNPECGCTTDPFGDSNSVLPREGGISPLELQIQAVLRGGKSGTCPNAVLAAPAELCARLDPVGLVHPGPGSDRPPWPHPGRFQHLPRLGLSPCHLACPGHWVPRLASQRPQRRHGRKEWEMGVFILLFKKIIV